MKSSDLAKVFAMTEEHQKIWLILDELLNGWKPPRVSALSAKLSARLCYAPWHCHAKIPSLAFLALVSKETKKERVKLALAKIFW